MSRKTKEENPFSFTNFAQDDSGLPFPDDPPPKASKSKTKTKAKTKTKTKTKTKSKKIIAQDDDINDDPFDIVGGDMKSNPVKNKKAQTPNNPEPENGNPYSFVQSGDVPTTTTTTISEPVSRQSSTATLSPPHVTPLQSDSSGSDISDSDDDDDKSTNNHNNNDDDDDDDDDTSSFDDDDDDDDDGDHGLPPAPVHQVTASNVAITQQKQGGTVASRIKRRMELLKQQLDAAKRDLSMKEEQYELDMAEMKEDNRSLRTALRAAQSTADEAKKKAASSTAALDRRKKTEKQEAAVLEDFTEKVQQNLESATQRAVNAEAQVSHLTAELNKLRSTQISGGALTQVKAASTHLNTLAINSEKSLRQLVEGVKTLQLASDILKHVGKIDVVGE